MNNLQRVVVGLATGLLCTLTAWGADQSLVPATGAGSQAAVVMDAYPALASGSLTYARLSDLPQGALIRAGEMTVSEKDLTDELAKAPAEMQEPLRKGAFYLAEQLFTQRLVLQLAKDDAIQSKRDISSADDNSILQGFLQKLLEPIKVTDLEVADFYAANTSMFEGAPLEKIKNQLAQYLLDEKRQEAVKQYIQTVGQRMTIEVSAPWAREQSKLAQENPVDKARLSGMPSLVDFGSKGCRPCDMLAPILETLKKKYEGNANVMFVSVVEEPILAARYGVQTIPVQVFFDKDGKEVFRHIGFFPQEELEKKMAEMGVK